jgi:hypothetical protein
VSKAPRNRRADEPRYWSRMIGITAAAFDAIAATLPLGSVSYENHVNERGERYVWLPPNVVDRLKTRRGLQRRDPASGSERIAHAA